MGDHLQHLSPRDWGKVVGQVGFEVGMTVASAGALEALNVAAKTSRLARMAVRVAELTDLEGLALKGAGKLASTLAGQMKVLGKLLTGAKKARRAVAAARRASAAFKNSKLGQKLGALRDFIGKDRCWWRGHPVDVATGLVSTDGVDFTLPGPIPLVWERTWYSRSTHAGALGHGWHHAYDLALMADATHVGLRRADGRLALFTRPVGDERVFNRAERLELSGDEALGFRVWDWADQLWYVFEQPARDGVYALSAVEDRSGHALRFAYSAAGHLQGIIDSAGRPLRVDTDAAGRLLALHAPDPDQPGATFALVRYAYSEAGDLVSVTDALGQALHFVYAGHLLTRETFRSGLRFYFTYDGVGSGARCVRTWGEGGLVDTTFRYDSPRQTTVWDSYGQAAVYTHQDGLVIHAVDEVGATRTWDYNAHLELERQVNPLGQAIAYAYDGRGNLTQTRYPDGTKVQTQYNAQHAPVQHTDALGGIWCWAYDAAGQLMTRTDPTGAATSYAYDATGRLATVTDALDQATRLRYDAQGQLIHLMAPDGSIRSRSYDTLGQLTSLTDARGHVERRHYDHLGRLIMVQTPTGEGQRLSYDAEGNVVRAEAGRQVVEYEYNKIGQIAQRRQDGQAVAFAYDLEGRLTGLTNERGEAYTFRLDAAGQVVEEMGFDGLTRRYTRDAAGRVTHLARPAGRTTAYTYDACGRVAELVHNGTERKTYAYRADGVMLAAIVANMEVRFECDALGRVLAETQGGHTVRSAYDLLGQRMDLTSSLGAAVTFERDALGQVRRTQAGEWQSVVGRDAEGLELHQQLSGGLRLDWQHDAAGRPTSQLISTGGRAERRRRYQWQGADQLTEIEDSVTGTTRYAYDALGALTGATYADGEQELRQPDAVGNLFRTAERTDRHYGPGGQLQQAGGTRYRHDAEGNLVRKTLADGEVWHYAWDGAGQLVEVKRPDGYAVTFAYDALGRRVSKRFRGKVTRWVWDGNQPLHEWSELEVGPGAGSVAELTTWLFEDESYAPLAKFTAHGAQSVVSDHLGTPLAMYDGQGKATWEMTLDSYGAVRQGRGKSQDCPFRYQGQYEDTETGLYYNRFRYYDLEAGSYISQDPIGLMGNNPTPYAYVATPTKLVDPLGLYNGDGKKGTPFRALNDYNVLHSHRLDPTEYTNTDKYHFSKANESLHTQIKADPQFAQALESKYPGISKRVAPRKNGTFSGKSPKGATWHHATAAQVNGDEGWLQLVDMQDHKDFHKIYHPTDIGGRNEWGGGTSCRK